MQLVYLETNQELWKSCVDYDASVGGDAAVRMGVVSVLQFVQMRSKRCRGWAEVALLQSGSVIVQFIQIIYEVCES